MLLVKILKKLVQKFIFSLLLISVSYSANSAISITPLPNMQELSLSLSALSNKDLLDWTSQIALSAYSSSQQELAKLKPYFTEGGYARLLAAVATVDKTTKSEASIAPGRNAAIVAQEINNNILAWRILIPVRVKQNNTEQTFMITVFVSRVDDPKNGLNITEFQARAS